MIPCTSVNPNLWPPKTDSEWNNVLMSCIDVEISIRNTLVFDDHSQFWDASVEICEIYDTEKQKARTQHHNVLGSRDRYYNTIRYNFSKASSGPSKAEEDNLTESTCQSLQRHARTRRRCTLYNNIRRPLFATLFPCTKGTMCFASWPSIKCSHSTQIHVGITNSIKA